MLTYPVLKHKQSFSIEQIEGLNRAKDKYCEKENWNDEATKQTCLSLKPILNQNCVRIHLAKPSRPSCTCNANNGHWISTEINKNKSLFLLKEICTIIITDTIKFGGFVWKEIWQANL